MQQVEMVMVTGENNNKYYKMSEQANNHFRAVWGRVGGHESNKVYPMSAWDKTYRAKIKKGYKDISNLRATKATKQTFNNMDCLKCQIILDELQAYSTNSVKQNYTISADSVTLAQVTEAQKHVDSLTALSLKQRTFTTKSMQVFNDQLLELYMTIPRKMGNVKNHLLKSKNNIADGQKMIANEQSLLDTMAQQVSMVNTKATPKGQSLAEILGITIELVNTKDITLIKNLMAGSSNKFKSAYKVSNVGTEKLYDKRVKKSYSKNSMLLWHGSRNENWLNIVKTGLLIRPSGVVLTGAMFGNGIYMADKAQKSIGYTSLSGSYWASGGSNQAFLALYDVNTGVEYQKKRHESSMYRLDRDNLRKLGKYDSFFAEGGADLRNNEFIIYEKEQCTVRYLVEIC